jgi:hypothetical protein
MLKIITTLTLFLVGILAKGQVSEDRSVSTFTKVKVQNGIELVYLQGDKPAIRIEAPESAALKNTVTKMSGKTLTIFLKNSSNQDMVVPNVKVYLTAHDLEELTVDSNAKITIPEDLYSKNIKIQLNSGAHLSGRLKIENTATVSTDKNTKFEGRIESAKLYADFSSNSKINLTGKSESATFKTSNSTYLNARNYASRAIDIKSSGKSVAVVNAHFDLSVDVTDEARVSYFGFPRNITLNEEASSYSKHRSDLALTLN